jgi:perosamine synthetase
VVSDAALRDSVATIYKDLGNPSLGRMAVTELQYLAFKTLRRPALYWRLQKLYHSLSKAGLLIGNFAAAEWNAEASPEYCLRMAPTLQARCRKARAKALAAAARRRQIAADYEAGLSRLNIPTLRKRPHTDAVLLRYPLLCLNKAVVLDQAQRAGIEVGSWFRTPVDPLTGEEFNKVMYRPGSCPVSETVSSRIVTLPIYDGVTSNAIERSLRFIGSMRDRGYIETRPAYATVTVSGCV